VKDEFGIRISLMLLLFVVSENCLIKKGKALLGGLYSYALRHTATNTTTSTRSCVIGSI
jgi:hypothetical protein